MSSATCSAILLTSWVESVRSHESGLPTETNAYSTFSLACVFALMSVFLSVVKCMVCFGQVHGSLLQVRHLLEAHAPSLQSNETHALLDRVAALLLDRLWLATPLCAASAIKAAYLRAAGALMSAAQLAESPRLGGNGSAAPVLARTVMGICQEALIAQDLPTAPAQLVAPSHESSAAVPTALPPALNSLSTEIKSTGPVVEAPSFSMAADAPAVHAGPDMHSSTDSGAVQPIQDELDAAGADGADVMRSVFLKEAVLLYFSPAMRRLASSETAGIAKPPHCEVPSTHRCQVCVNV